jgi:uncharacterized protein YecT (DUF1311 family)
MTLRILVMPVTLALIICAGLVAARAEAPSAKDVKAVQACLAAKGARPGNREACIGVVANPCIGKEEERAPSEVMECLERERLVWDQLLNSAFGKLRDGLDEDQRAKLREMQRSWVDTRDRTCGFYHHYFQGSMANPMMANCNNRETARRALFLLGFSEDLAN